jgi:hypothetical protein
VDDNWWALRLTVFLDLGYTSSADCKLIASGRPEGGVQATSDAMGLIYFFLYWVSPPIVYDQFIGSSLWEFVFLDTKSALRLFMKFTPKELPKVKRLI